MTTNIRSEAFERKKTEGPKKKDIKRKTKKWEQTEQKKKKSS